MDLPRSAGPAAKRPLMLAIVLAATLTAAALTLNRLGAADVCGSNEAVEGVFMQQIVEHGQVLFPLENGHSPMYKPPLFHWTGLALDALIGAKNVTAFNLRLPAALYAIAGVALTTVFAWDFIGAFGAALAGLILCGSYQYIEQGRIGRVDMTLTFFEASALFVFMWWYARASESTTDGSRGSTLIRRESLRYLFALALGLGVLAKGPVGAFLPAAACGIFLLVRGRFAELAKIAAPGPVLLAIVVGGSWYAACLTAHRYGFLHRQLGSENFGRFFGTLGAMAPWYYVKPLLLNSAPLSLIVPVAFYAALATFWRDTAGLSDNPRTKRATEAVRLLAIFWIITVVFFSLAAYKRRAYLLPLWPPAAVMVAWWIESLTAHLAGRVLRAVVALTCAGLIIFNGIYIPRREARDCGNDSFRDVAAEIDRIVGRDEPLYSYGFADDPATLLFYLKRDVPPIDGKLGDAPPGYVVVPVPIWHQRSGEALDLSPVYESTAGRPPIVLLRHGRALAAR